MQTGASGDPGDKKGEEGLKGRACLAWLQLQVAWQQEAKVGVCVCKSGCCGGVKGSVRMLAGVGKGQWRVGCSGPLDPPVGQGRVCL